MEKKERIRPVSPEARRMLHEGTKARSNVGKVMELRAGKVRTEAPRTFEKWKDETNAISTLLLTSMAPAIIRKLYGPDGQKVFIDSVDDHRGKKSADMDVMQKLEAAYQSLGILAYRAVRDWEESIDSQPLTDQKAYRRLGSLILEHPKWAHAETPDELIASGFKTASFVYWDVIRAIPIAYYWKTGSIVSTNDFERMIRDAEPIAMELASMEGDRFAEFTDIFETTDLNLKNKGPVLPAEFFEVQLAADGSPHLVLDEDLVRYWYRNTKIKPQRQSRLGCPARGAIVQDVDGKTSNLLSVGYQYSIEMAQQLLRPHLEEYTKKTLAKARGEISKA